MITDEETLEAVKEIIAVGCACDRLCMNPMFEPDGYCGCKNEAQQIITLIKSCEEEVEK